MIELIINALYLLAYYLSPANVKKKLAFLIMKLVYNFTR